MITSPAEADPAFLIDHPALRLPALFVDVSSANPTIVDPAIIF